MRRLSIVGLSILACLSMFVFGLSLARADDTVTLKLAYKTGQTWTFNHTEDDNTDIKTTVNGQTVAFTTKTHSHRAGKAQVMAVKDGAPTSLRITFDDSCESSSENVGHGEAQKVPFPFAGKTVTITRNDDGTVQDDFNDKAEPDAINELHAMLEQEAALFPGKPVAVNDEWAADPKALARLLQLQNDDRGGMTLKLLSVKQMDGRPVAELKISLAATRNMQGINVKMVMQGIGLVDMKTGHMIKNDMKGTTDASGDQTGPGQNGQPVSYHIDGSGTVAATGVSNLTDGGNGLPTSNPLGGGTAGGNPPAVNPLAPPAGPSFAGKFTDGELTFDCTATGDTCNGTITLADKQYPATAQIKDQSLDGSFDAGGNKFAFTAKLDGDTMSFTTGTKTRTLKRAAPANPLGN